MNWQTYRMISTGNVFREFSSMAILLIDLLVNIFVLHIITSGLDRILENAGLFLYRQKRDAFCALHHTISLKDN